MAYYNLFVAVQPNTTKVHDQPRKEPLNHVTRAAMSTARNHHSLFVDTW
jgi:hypothetical protein